MGGSLSLQISLESARFASSLNNTDGEVEELECWLDGPFHSFYYVYQLPIAGGYFDFDDFCKWNWVVTFFLTMMCTADMVLPHLLHWKGFWLKVLSSFAFSLL